MIKSRPFLIWSHALRVVLVLALLAIAPLYETAHAMPVSATMPVSAAMSITMPDMIGQSEGVAPKADGRVASRQAHDAACRILCFGWVVTALPTRPAGLITKAALLLSPAVIALPDSLTPAPGDHPPKPAHFA